MLYIVTGPAGVGKSTISKGIAQSLNKSVLIEGDDIYHHVVGGYVSPWKEGNHLDVFWEVSIQIINSYLKNGYDVIFNYIIEQDKMNKIRTIFDNIPTKFVVLLVGEKTLLERDRQRPIDCQMKERCIVLLNNFINNQFDEKHILYTDNLSISECISEIKNNDKYLIKN